MFRFRFEKVNNQGPSIDKAFINSNHEKIESLSKKIQETVQISTEKFKEASQKNV